MRKILKAIGFILSVFTILMIFRIVTTNAMDRIDVLGIEGVLEKIWRG